MAEKEKIKVIEIDVQEAQKSIKDLKKDIEALAVATAKLDKGTDEYEKSVAKLAEMQGQLDEAMSLSKRAAKDAEGSYNALSKRMAELRKQWKATGDAAERADLAAQINEINDELKEMDASTGNFQRNVGNYSGSIIDAFGKFGQAASSATGAAVGGFEMATQAAKLFQASNPIGAITLALSFLIQNLHVITDLLEKDASKALDAFKKEAEKTAEQIERIGDDADFDEKVAEAAGVSEEAILRMRLEAARAAHELAVLNKEQADELKTNIFNRKKVAEAQQEAADKEQEAYDRVKAVLDDMTVFEVRKQHERTTVIKEATKEQAEAIAAALGGTGNPLIDEAEEEVEAMLAEREQAIKDSNAKFLADEKAYNDERARLWAEAAAKKKEYDAAEAKSTKDKMAVEQASFAATKAIFNGIADVMEASAEGSEKNAQAIKSLRIASAIVDTLQAGLAAYRAGMEIGGPAGLAVGAAQMATALATGWATVAKIRSTQVSREAAPATSTANPSTQAYSPAVVREVNVTRTLTGAAEEERLNRTPVVQAVVVSSQVEADIMANSNRKGESTF